MQSQVLEHKRAVCVSAEDGVAALMTGAGVADRSHTGRLRIDGDDALDLLNRLSTNKLDDLAVGDAIGTVVTTNKGRIIDKLVVLRCEDHLLALTGADTRERIADWVEFYTFVEDVEVSDATGATVMFSLAGPGSVEALPALGGLPIYGAVSLDVDGVGVTAIRTDFAGVAGFDLIADAEQGQALWDALMGRGVAAVDEQALDAVRIRNGATASGRELTEDYNPIEANLMDCISFNKGCYIGQEVVARLNTYEKVQRRLVKLSWTGQSPGEGMSLSVDGKSVGTVTSAAVLPSSSDGVGLGYVRKAQAEPGLRLAADNGAEAVVGEILFRYNN